MKALVKSKLTKVKQLHKEISKEVLEIAARMKMAIPKVVEAGGLLTELKAEIGHGKWLAWQKANLPFTDRTARNYMRVWEDRAKLETVSNLTEAYKLLEAPKGKVPEEPEDSNDLDLSKYTDEEDTLGDEDIDVGEEIGSEEDSFASAMLTFSTYVNTMRPIVEGVLDALKNRPKTNCADYFNTGVEALKRFRELEQLVIEAFKEAHSMKIKGASK
jgi:hypothetical protein